MLSWLGRKQTRETARFKIAGMSCGGCVQHVKSVLQSLPGVEAQQVEVGSAVVAWDPKQSSEQSVVEALAAAGFQASREALE